MKNNNKTTTGRIAIARLSALVGIDSPMKSAIEERLTSHDFSEKPLIAQPTTAIQHDIIRAASEGKLRIDSFPLGRDLHHGLAILSIKKILQFLTTRLVTTRTDTKHKHSVLELDGIAKSKAYAWGYRFGSMIEFAEYINNPKAINNQHTISCEGNDAFEGNIRYILEHNSNPVIYYRHWQDRYEWDNCDGSHHMAALVKQCLKEERNYHMPCTLVSVHGEPELLSREVDALKVRVLMVHEENMLPLLTIAHEFGLAAGSIMPVKGGGPGLLVICGPTRSNYRRATLFANILKNMKIGSEPLAIDFVNAVQHPEHYFRSSTRQDVELVRKSFFVKSG